MSLQNLCLRLPFELHKEMKKQAKAEGVTASALYAQALTHFLDHEIARWPYLFTGQGSTTATLYIDETLVTRVREAADRYDHHISDIATSALVMHLGKHPFAQAA